jgi:NADH dehydrogenase
MRLMQPDVPTVDRHSAGSSGLSRKHRVVVVGGGFGGLETVRRLAGAPVEITLIDQHNHHIFQPLLYQVATASLAPSEVAWPIRVMVRKRPEVTTLLATVVGVDTAAREVRLDGGERIAYDTLVLATGARHAYFGHDEWEPFAPGLKTLEDAATIRRRILLAFEEAERAADPAQRAALLTFVIVGAGPTGVELAGTIADLARTTLAGDFRHIDPRTARVLLIEAGPRVLAGYPEDLSAYAQRALESLGVTVELSLPVSSCAADGVVYGDRQAATRTIIWAAGVRASPAGDWLGADTDGAGRVKVAADLTVPGRPEIFAIGDTVMAAGPDGRPAPGIAPAAKQAGAYVAKVIKARLRGRSTGPFVYVNQGNLAQIGERRAVIDFGWIQLRGALAWWIWGIAHIYFLIALRQRFSVAFSWLWTHTLNQRGARLITQGDAWEIPEGNSRREGAGLR